MKTYLRTLPLISLVLACFLATELPAQDWVHTGTNLGNERSGWPRRTSSRSATIRRCRAEGGLRRHAVQRSGQRRNLRHGVEEHGAAGHAGLAAGDQRCRSGRPRRPTPPWWPSAHFRQTTAGWSSTAGSSTPATPYPQVLGKQYNEAASQDMARTVAHRFADEIISRLGGGINGIAETKIYFVSSRTGSKEIWAMDYDGQNQHADHPSGHHLAVAPHLAR